jgi:uncharacterized protein YgfB (UPF0149 family)
MFRYLKFKKKKYCNKRFIYLIEKKRKWHNKEKKKYISKKSSFVIEGLHASGKTRELLKIHEKKYDIWSEKENFILIKASDSLSDWLNKNIDKKTKETFINEHKENIEIIENIRKQHIKIAQLIFKAENGIVLIDDIDKLSGKKKEIVKDLIKVSKITIATATEYKDIDKTIEKLLKSKNIELIQLTTDASYDATFVLFAIFVVMLFAAGQHELAILVMAGRYAMKGIQK